MDEFMANIGARIMIALFLGLIGYGLARMFINMFIMPFTKEKELQKANEHGRVVTAYFVKSIHPKGVGAGSDDTVFGIYEYHYNGKTYKYKGIYSLSAPANEILYFKKNPKNACNRIRFGKMENGKFVLFAIISLIVFIATWFFF